MFKTKATYHSTQKQCSVKITQPLLHFPWKTYPCEIITTLFVPGSNKITTALRHRNLSVYLIHLFNIVSYMIKI